MKKEHVDKIVEIVKTQLLKQCHLMVHHENGYPSEAVPKATILSLSALVSKALSGLELEQCGDACDVCGNHPNPLIQTQFGRFCQLHARYI